VSLFRVILRSIIKYKLINLKRNAKIVWKYQNLLFKSPEIKSYFSIKYWNIWINKVNNHSCYVQNNLINEFSQIY